MKTVFLLFLAASTLHFDITDARGKKPSGISLEVSEPDDEGWMRLKVVNKGKGTPVLIWPYDGKVKPQDGPGEIPALVMESGDLKALANPRVIAALEAGRVVVELHIGEVGYTILALGKKAVAVGAVGFEEALSPVK